MYIVGLHGPCVGQEEVKFMRSKRWFKPHLTVLAKSEAQEAVLNACACQGAPVGPAMTRYGTYIGECFAEAPCTSCKIAGYGLA